MAEKTFVQERMLADALDEVFNDELPNSRGKKRTHLADVHSTK
jgi:hypothetical protein